mmetsp:Transcript_39977/g.82247  ORF Transcript_39977/g.82247 Transcript_39977/m.82247 type:complete len:1159 (-) Transcript_39977:502-3978(-)
MSVSISNPSMNFLSLRRLLLTCRIPIPPLNCYLADLDDPDFWEKAVGLQAPPDPEFDELAQLMTDGKRHRKQVQQYDPYADDKAAEQKKQERIAELEREEEEERVVRRLAKFLERQDKRDSKKKRKREEAEAARERERPASGLVPKKKKKKRHFLGNDASALQPSSKESKSKESKSKQSRKAERRRALRRAEKEDPVLERVRQAWEVPHRNRVTSAALRFGFGRFSKIRQEANLNSVPLQDIEVFARAYLFQLGVQGSVSLAEDSDPKGRKLESAVASIYNQYGTRDSDWIFNAMNASLTMLEEVGNRSRYLRIPLVLADPDYLNELRAGAALRALRRFALLSRVNAIVEKALDGLLRELGTEELGRRGIFIKNLSLLDVDLKARHVSTEELLQAVGIYLPCQSSTTMKHYPLPSSITPWWDRSCDSALIIGTFIHGCGNYETMRNDDELPFSRRILGYIASDPASAKAHLCFQQATKTAKAVYVDALKTAKRRQQIESHEAVAAVIAASKDVAEAGEVSNGNAGDKDVPSSIAGVAKPKKSTIVDDSDTITLHRLSRSLIKAIQEKSESLSEGEGFTFGSSSEILSRGKKKLGDHPHRCLPMPDAMFLDSYLSRLIDSIDCAEDMPDGANEEGHSHVSHATGSDPDADTFSKASAVNAKIAAAGLGDADSKTIARSLQGLLCGSRHKSLNDHSSYDHGAASSDLASLATGADSTRYKRGPCVPLYLTRYSICALVYADISVVDASCEAKRREIDMIKENRKRTKPPILSSEESSSARSVSGATATEEAVSEKITSRPMTEETNASEPKHECVYAIPSAILNDVHIRAGLCVALLKSGSPASDHDALQRASHDVYKAARGCTTTTPNQDTVPTFFDTKALAQEAARLVGNNIIFPCGGSVQSYINDALLPHCLRLCMEGEAILSNDTSRLSVHGRAHNIVRSPIPDPCLPVEMHSEEAIRYASMILRRVRLTRTVRFVAGGGIPFEEVMSTLHGPSLRKSLGCLPLWWCPWIHDLGLLLHVAMHGLVGLTNTHEDGVWDVLSLRRIHCFELDALRKHIRSIFVEGMDENPPSLPAQMLKSSSSEDVDTWIRLQADLLPSGKVLERRIALICSEMTRHMPDEKIIQAGAEESKETSSSMGSYKYDSIPMFDLGGWPKNE